MPNELSKSDRFMSAEECGDKSEKLAAIALCGRLARRNCKGFDFTSREYGRVEVKSRRLGTDGAWPRVTLSASKMDLADTFLAVRWTKCGDFVAAVALPKCAATPLYRAWLQKCGKVAHIPWRAWDGCEFAIDLSEQMLMAGARL